MDCKKFIQFGQREESKKASTKGVFLILTVRVTHRKNAHCDSGDHERKKDKKSKKKSSSEEERRKKRSCRRWKHHDSKSDSESLVSSDDDDNEIVKRNHRLRRRSVSGTSDTSSDENDCRIRKRSHTRHHKHRQRPAVHAPRRQSHSNHNKHHQRSNSVVSGSLDSDDERPYQRGRSLGNSSDDNLESRNNRSGQHHHHYHHHHHRPLHRHQPHSEAKNHLSGNSVEPNGKNREDHL
ncbi:hypothetical protein V6Z11_1Z109500 [Gossypium hirsutum]